MFSVLKTVKILLAHRRWHPIFTDAVWLTGILQVLG